MGVTVSSVSKKIGKSKVLDSVSLQAADGEIIGLSGINGSGKTMLMRVIAGLVHPTSGEVTIDGRALGTEIEFPPSMGMLIESPAFLDSRTGRDNLRLIASLRGVPYRFLDSSLKSVGLDPEDARKYRKYSLGMRQRLGLAAAFLGDPKLLLLDEPMNALDEDGIELARRCILERKNRGSIIFIACHDARTLEELSDRIYYLKEGRVVDGW